MIFIQMSGVPGSGKSTLSKSISEYLDVVVVDHDVTKTSLMGMGNNQLSSLDIGKVSYDIDWLLIEMLLSQNKNVIFDSPCLYDEIIEKGMALSEKYRATYKYVECKNMDFNDIMQRLKSRKAKISQITKYKSYDVFYKALIGSKRPDNDNFIIVDTSQPISSYIMRVVHYINN
ncbi:MULTISPECIES: AAA family ATPase [Vagococcus]|uniref:AAA family ATPase n=1 Tax=Vagococcus TaxID=2737 RepID=UPI000E48A53D|nr:MULTISPECIES: AAA family ATPase [Vagococcus]RHH68066.1 ATP-binding protein [Vagococcus sp. AM17-17]